ncbi:30S ribosomal protein S11 [Candidatus Carsonella ruddii]|uniref:30S ribosomal protein S11 n=1 Tax=Carsonella ruddii TaxID=114186 RepID=UPI003D814C81
MKLYNKNYGIIYINSSFNNTISTLTDKKGNTLMWYSSGSLGFKGPKKKYITSFSNNKRENFSICN